MHRDEVAHVKLVLPLALAIAGAACASTADNKPGVTRAPFGRFADGTAVELFTLTNSRGMEVRTMPYGAIIV
jgi:aldose 1-epimerase